MTNADMNDKSARVPTVTSSKSVSLVDRIVENLERIAAKSGKRRTEEKQEKDTKKEKPRWKSRFGSSMAVMDANPRTKRIKDLQEQIHA